MQVLNEGQKELGNHRVALATAKSQYERAKDGLDTAKETEVRYSKLVFLHLMYLYPQVEIPFPLTVRCSYNKHIQLQVILKTKEIENRIGPLTARVDELLWTNNY